MRIKFLGAAKEVTGSCHLFEVGKHRVLLDCGLIQGRPSTEARNKTPLPIAPNEIDAIILSHAHIDHSGRLPWLVKQGYVGPIYAHRATQSLCQIMLRDSAYLQEKDVEWENKKRQRKGLDPVEPLYTMADAQETMTRFRALDYRTPKEILPGFEIELHDAGHILGSSIVELRLSEGPVKRTVVFTGDLGHVGTPLMPSPATISKADLVLMESTYGDRLHRSWESTWEEVKDVVSEVKSSKGNILIPAFAVGRTQELLYLFSKYYTEWDMARWQIFLDSPLAIEATRIYSDHANLLEGDAGEIVGRLGEAGVLANLHFTPEPEQSMQLNKIRAGAIIIAGSGMCTGGRIKQHIKHHAWRNDTHIVIVGFQAEGTPGRALVDGAPHLRLWGETIRIAAKVHTIGGLSAHADQAGLLAWYRHFESRPPVVLVHGEPPAMETLAKKIADDFGAPVFIPDRGATFDLHHRKMA